MRVHGIETTTASHRGMFRRHSQFRVQAAGKVGRCVYATSALGYIIVESTWVPVYPKHDGVFRGYVCLDCETVDVGQELFQVEV